MRVVFMGTPDFSVPILERLIEEKYNVVLVVTQPDRPKGRKKVMTPPPVKPFAEQHGIPVFQPEKIRGHEALEYLFSFLPDLVVTAAFGQILPKALLDFPKYGCLNVHASLLPEYRGGAPIHRAIMEGKDRTGITIMYMAEKMDAGDILAQSVVMINENDNVGTLHDRLSIVGASLLIETLEKLKNGTLSPTSQKEEEVTFAPNIKREDEKINWSRDGNHIYNHIRGLNPWPGAYTLYQRRVLKIWQVEKTFCPINALPGTIVNVDSSSFLVQSGDDVALRVKELQPAGKKRMACSVFLKGTLVEKGEQLGTT